MISKIHEEQSELPLNSLTHWDFKGTTLCILEVSISWFPGPLCSPLVSPVYSHMKMSATLRWLAGASRTLSSRVRFHVGLGMAVQAWRHGDSCLFPSEKMVLHVLPCFWHSHKSSSCAVSEFLGGTAVAFIQALQFVWGSVRVGFCCHSGCILLNFWEVCPSVFSSPLVSITVLQVPTCLSCVLFLPTYPRNQRRNKRQALPTFFLTLNPYIGKYARIYTCDMIMFY